MRSVTVFVLALLAFGGYAESPEQAQIDFANGLFQREFFKEAAEEYQAYLDKCPEGEHVKTALYRLGEALYAAQQYEEALKAFDRLLGLDLDELTRQRALLSKGEVLHFLKRPADAVLVLEPLTGEEVAPDVRARALYQTGKLSAESDDTAAAIKAFKTLIDNVPESRFVPFARYQLAFVYLAREEVEQAAVEFSGAAGDSRAEPELRMESRYRAAEAYDRIGWFGAAVKAYEQLKHDFPDSEYAHRAEYGYAWALYHAGKYAEAAAAGEAFIQKHPDLPEAIGVHYLLGNCLQQQKQYERALEVYTGIRKEHNDSPFAARSHYKIAWCLYLSGKTQEAREEALAFLRAPRDESLVGDTAFLLGSIMASEEDYDNAYEEFRLVAEKYAGGEFGAEALYKAGECLAQLGRTDEAAKVFETFANQYPAHTLTEQAILRAGDAELSAAAFDAAVEKYKKILEAPGDPGMEENTLYRLAITYHNMKNHEASANTFRTIIEKFPDSRHTAEAHFRIAEYLLREGKDPVKVIESYEAAMAVDPDGDLAGRALKGLALARYEMKDHDAAAELFLRLMTEYRRVPLNEQTYAWVGQRLFDQQKWDQAVAAFNALLEANPDYPNPERVRFKIAECREAAGKPSEAIKLYQAVVDLAPRTSAAVDARFRMAKLYEAQNKPKEAFTLYEEAANMDTGDTAARARFRLGELYEEKEELDAAVRSYMRVAILFLHEELSPKALWRAGQCLERSDSVAQANKRYEELIQDYPNSEEAAKAKDALGKLGEGGQ